MSLKPKSDVFFSSFEISLTPSWITKKPSCRSKCLNSLRPFSKPTIWIEPSAQMMSKVSPGRSILIREHFFVTTRVERLSSWIFSFNLSSDFWSTSIPVIFPSLIFANSMVGFPEPQPTSRICWQLILGRLWKACLVYFRKCFLIWSFFVSNIDSIDVFSDLHLYVLR